LPLIDSNSVPFDVDWSPCSCPLTRTFRWCRPVLKSSNTSSRANFLNSDLHSGLSFSKNTSSRVIKLSQSSFFSISVGFKALSSFPNKSEIDIPIHNLISFFSITVVFPDPGDIPNRTWPPRILAKKNPKVCANCKIPLHQNGPKAAFQLGTHREPVKNSPSHRLACELACCLCSSFGIKKKIRTHHCHQPPATRPTPTRSIALESQPYQKKSIDHPQVSAWWRRGMEMNIDGWWGWCCDCDVVRIAIVIEFLTAILAGRGRVIFGYGEAPNGLA